MSPAEEQVVLEAIAAGNESRFADLVSANQSKIYAFMVGMVGNRHDAEELTQETFLSAYRNIGSFAGRSSIYTWLRRIAFNLAIDRQRKSKSRRKHGSSGMDGTEIADVKSVDPSSAAEASESIRLVRLAMDRLSAEERNIIVLRDIQSLDYAEMADLLEIPVGTVRSRLHRARIELRNVLVSLGVTFDGNSPRTQSAQGGGS